MTKKEQLKMRADIQKKVAKKLKSKMHKLRIKVLKTDEDVKMVLDPYRKTIIKTYLKNKEPMTVKQVADALDEVPAKVHYHVKKMIDYGLLELAKTETVNGIVAKYYQPLYDQFRMEASELSNEVYLAQRPVIEEIFNKISKHIREDLDRHMELVSHSKGKVQRHIVANMHELYLTPDEQTEISNYLEELDEKYSEPREGTEQYSMHVTMVRTK